MAEEKNNKEKPNSSGMLNNNTTSEKKTGGSQGLEFILFLILILLLLGNQKSFGTHFEKLNKEINKVNQLLNAFSATAEGLKTTVEAPQKIFNQKV